MRKFEELDREELEELNENRYENNGVYVSFNNSLFGATPVLFSDIFVKSNKKKNNLNYLNK